MQPEAGADENLDTNKTISLDLSNAESDEEYGNPILPSDIRPPGTVKSH